jgi:glycerate dehydrogenase
MNIVILDSETLGPDLPVDKIKEFGNVTLYPRSFPDDVVSKVENCDIIITNKVRLNRETLESSSAKLVLVAATGTNNVDLEACKDLGIEVANVSGYSTESVAQHTFALFFALVHRIHDYHQFVVSGMWTQSGLFTNFGHPFFNLSGKTWGIFGMGNIGKEVAKIASAFGCHVIYSSRTPKKQYEHVEFDELLARSDILSIHCPLTDDTRDKFNMAAFKAMKKSAVLINVSRGPVIQEHDLKTALETKEIQGAGLDVLSKEPPAADHPLLHCEAARSLVITPHNAWASKEARMHLFDGLLFNLSQFRDGVPLAHSVL